MFLRAHTHACMHGCMRACLYAHMHAFSTLEHGRIYACANMLMHACPRMYAFPRMHVHMHACIHARIHACADVLTWGRCIQVCGQGVLLAFLHLFKICAEIVDSYQNP